MRIELLPLSYGRIVPAVKSVVKRIVPAAEDVRRGYTRVLIGLGGDFLEPVFEVFGRGKRCPKTEDLPRKNLVYLVKSRVYFQWQLVCFVVRKC